MIINILFVFLFYINFIFCQLTGSVGPTTKTSKKSTICNVLDYGGKADNKTDIGPFIVNTFKNCVIKKKYTSLYIPYGNYLLKSQVLLNGNGFQSWTFRLDGLITASAPSKYNSFNGNMIFIRNTGDFEMYTSNKKGAIQGQGYVYRNIPNQPGRSTWPRMVRILNCKNCSIHDLLLVDSPSFHLIVSGSYNIEVYRITIRGGYQGGLDGIDIDADNYHVHDVEVSNRDECISIKNGSKNALIENIRCNSSGGCSIGSLNMSTVVENIHLRNIENYNVVNSMMIKTFPGGNGYVKNILMENITNYDVLYAIDINQYWYNHYEPNTDAVNLYNITFKDWYGTVNNGISRGPIFINGSNIVLPYEIYLKNINMWTINGNKIIYTCNNAYGNGYCLQSTKTNIKNKPYKTIQTVTSKPSNYKTINKPKWGIEPYSIYSSIPVYSPTPFYN